MVEMELVMEHLRLAASRNDSASSDGQSGGLLDPAVATANATAAFAELDLQRSFGVTKLEIAGRPPVPVRSTGR